MPQVRNLFKKFRLPKPIILKTILKKNSEQLLEGPNKFSQDYSNNSTLEENYPHKEETIFKLQNSAHAILQIDQHESRGSNRDFKKSKSDIHEGEPIPESPSAATKLSSEITPYQKHVHNHRLINSASSSEGTISYLSPSQLNLSQDAKEISSLRLIGNDPLDHRNEVESIISTYSRTNDSVTIFGTGSDAGNDSEFETDWLKSNTDSFRVSDDSIDSFDEHDISHTLSHKIHTVNSGDIFSKRKMDDNKKVLGLVIGGSTSKLESMPKYGFKRKIFAIDFFASAIIIFCVATAIITIKTILSILCALTALCGIYLPFQERHLLRHEDNYRRKRILFKELSRMKALNTHLRGKVLLLKVKMQRMEVLNAEFEEKFNGIHLSPVHVTSMIEETRSNQQKFKQYVRENILHLLMKTIFLSNPGDKLFVINPITIGILNSKMRQIPNISFYPENLKNLVKRFDGSLEAILELCRVTLSDNIPQDNSFFLFAEQDTVSL